MLTPDSSRVVFQADDDGTCTSVAFFGDAVQDLVDYLKGDGNICLDDPIYNLIHSLAYHGNGIPVFQVSSDETFEIEVIENNPITQPLCGMENAHERRTRKLDS